MGGSLSDKRLSAEEMLAFLARINPILAATLAGFEYQMVPYYRSKPDFGDVDFVVKADAGDIIPLVKPLIDNEAGVMQVNDGIVSFTMENFQVDLICTKHHYRTSLDYYSYNEVGQLLGSLCYQIGLKNGHTGLVWRKPEVPVSRDMKDILTFFGLDYEKWKSGFDTMENIFAWIVTSNYFDPAAFQTPTRKHAARSGYQRFMQWMKDTNPPKRHRFGDPSNPHAIDYIARVDEHFGTDVAGSVLADLEKEFAAKLHKQRFNGGIVGRVTGLRDKDLGDFIVAYKKRVADGDEAVFADAVRGMENVEESIGRFFEEFSTFRNTNP